MVPVPRLFPSVLYGLDAPSLAVRWWGMDHLESEKLRESSSLSFGGRRYGPILCQAGARNCAGPKGRSGRGSPRGIASPSTKLEGRPLRVDAGVPKPGPVVTQC